MLHLYNEFSNNVNQLIVSSFYLCYDCDNEYLQDNFWDPRVHEPREYKAFRPKKRMERIVNVFMIAMKII